MHNNQSFMSLRPERSEGKQSRKIKWEASSPFVGYSHTKPNLLRSGDRHYRWVAICGSLSVGRDRGRTEDQGQRTACNKPVPRLPSPVRLSAISYQLPTTDYKLGGLTQRVLFEQPRTSEVPSAKRRWPSFHLSPFSFQLSATTHKKTRRLVASRFLLC